MGIGDGGISVYKNTRTIALCLIDMTALFFSARGWDLITRALTGAWRAIGKELRILVALHCWEVGGGVRRG